jgi:16S rRNA (adenine1518-N6/adenine1519-N6)-dimethyltransferase
LGQRLGQHFLHSDRMVERIAAAVCRSQPRQIIEVGPGKGVLTQRLLSTGAEVIAIELDPAMVAILRERFPDHPCLTIVEADVLSVDLAQWGSAVLAGNLPYYITSPILERIFRARAALTEAVLLIQKEVAERLTAPPNCRDYGYLSVATQTYSSPEYLFQVKPGMFRPPPKVDSAVVRLTLRPDAADAEAFLTFASHCFAQKRKTLRNNLAPFYGHEVVDALPEAGLRAEQLSVTALRELYQRLIT